ncbi:MAG: MSMEG_4193 family putative phosphomutase [Acidimicrobiales bacterium]
MQRPRRHATGATVVCFVRHGTTPTTGKVLPGRARGLHLADAGRKEADGAAERLSGTAVSAVYSSPLERARETAARIAERTGKPVVIEKGLVECDFGEWTGAELSKLRKLPEWKTVQHWPSGFRFPGGESFQEVQGRLQATVRTLCERHRGEVIVAVSHADCIKAALASALGVPLDLFQRIVVGPCSTSVIAYGSEGPAVLAMNSYGALPGLRTRDGTTKTKKSAKMGSEPR